MDSWGGGSQHKERAHVWSDDSALLPSAAEQPEQFPPLSQSCGWDGASLPGDSRKCSLAPSLQVPAQAEENLSSVQALSSAWSRARA